jgi:hypothetical protein
MERRLRVLFTNNTLAEPAGTELSLHDAALALKSRGHEVAAFSTKHGAIAQRLIAADVPVVADLDRLPWTPEIIHGHHEWETTIAAVRWPQVPVVSFCRGPYLWQETPCLAPNVSLYAAVDEECRRRLVEKEGIPAAKVELVLNGVDLDKFLPRSPLPAKPLRALIFSNYASDQNFVPIVRAACDAEGIELTVMGRGAGNPCDAPHKVLGNYDIVLAKGKAALESLAVGGSLIVADSAGLGPVATRENFDSLRRLSFGNPTMTEPFSVAAVQERLRQFNAIEAAAVSATVREACGLKHTIDRIEAVYARAVAEHTVASAERWAQFATAFLTSHTSPYKLGRRVQQSWHELWNLPDPAHLDPETMDRIFTHFVQNESKRAQLQERCDRLRAELDALKAKNSAGKSRHGLFGNWGKRDDAKRK